MTNKLYNPALNGLVLAGGYSTRMGEDKGKIKWHGIEQRYFLSDLLKNYCSEVFISCRKEKVYEINSGYTPLPDVVSDKGPMSGIETAFKFDPNKAWLIIACDMPLLNHEAIEYLIEKRNPNKIATAYKNNEDDSPEPLICIWEPNCITALDLFLKSGKASPRQFLMQNEIETITSRNPVHLMNINNPGDKEKMEKLLNKS